MALAEVCRGGTALCQAWLRDPTLMALSTSLLVPALLMGLLHPSLKSRGQVAS